MIHSLFPLLLSLLLFSGCAAQNPPETLPPPAIQTAEAAAPGLSLEVLSDTGVLRQYSLSAPVSGMMSLGDNLLLFSGELTLISPENREVLAAYAPSVLLTPENFTVQRLHHGLSYFDGTAGETVVLDEMLREVRRISVPEDLTGVPLLSGDGKNLYYCTPAALRVLELSTGISRVLKETAYPVQGVSGMLLGDTVVQLSITDTDGTWRTLSLCAETGRLLLESEGNILPETTADRYFVRTEDGSILFGATTEAPMVLHPKRYDSDCFFLPGTYTAMTAALEGDTTLLGLYDLSTGGRRADCSFPGMISPRSVCQTDDEAIWFLTEATPGILYRWDAEACPVSDLKQYSSPYHTRDNPDYDGLAACALLAREIGAKYGVEILVYRDAVAEEPWDYRLDYEFEATVLRRELEALDSCLGRFPEGFLKTLAETFTALKICLVGDIVSTAGGPEAVSGIQFLDGFDAYIALHCGEDTEKALYHELCHLMETVVLTRSTAYDRWDNLNPEGFQYGEFPADSPYLQQGRAYFMDAYAMTQPKEDRARLFEYAMTAGHEELFRSPNLQRKLKQLSIGIRESFGLEDHPEMLPWEQYLSDSCGGW